MNFFALLFAIYFIAIIATVWKAAGSDEN